MRIMLTGAFGQLGHSLTNVLNKKHDLILTGREIPASKKGIKLNIQNKIHLNEIIQSTEPDIIINLAAMTNVDDCEVNPTLAREINIAGVQNIIESFSGKIIQISTDYVFDGKNGPYSESDEVSPVSIYGQTKLDAEKILLESNNNHLIIRGNVLYDYNPYIKSSFLNWVIQSLQNGNEINVANDIFNNPTWSRSMADIIKICLSNDVNGILHWGDKDYISRYDFAKIISEKFSLKSSLIKPISSSELGLIAPRPLNSGLISEKAIKLLNVLQPSIDDCLNEILQKKI
tara:strand:+ start:210 stop:1073 length:864 start_codon:yes stop_codon:yes gene_type:complete